MWQAAQGFFSFDAMAGVAIDCPVAITIIAPASYNAEADAAILVTTARIFAFCIVALLCFQSIQPALAG